MDNNSEGHTCPEVPLKPQRRGNEIAIVASGSFWYSQLVFQQLDGVHQVTTGYTGGTHRTPNSDNTRDHLQAVLIEYNPNVVSYSDLLSTWKAVVENGVSSSWEKHSRPLHHALAIFPTSQFQLGQVLRFIRYQTQIGSQCTFRNVRVGEPGPFYRAEEHHQDYITKLQRRKTTKQRLFTVRHPFTRHIYHRNTRDDDHQLHFHQGGRSSYQMPTPFNRTSNPPIRHGWERRPPARCEHMHPAHLTSSDAVGSLLSTDAVCENTEINKLDRIKIYEEYCNNKN